MTTKGFTKIDNYILLDTDLSLEAKGLYAILKHLSTIPNFKIARNYVKSISGYGETAFRRVWKELKEIGLLIEIKARNKGKYVYTYTLNASTFENTKEKVPAKKVEPKYIDSDGNIPIKGQVNIDDVIQEIPIENGDVKLVSEFTGFTTTQSKEILTEAKNNVPKVMGCYRYVKEQSNVKNAFSYTKWAVNNLVKQVNITSNKKESSFNNFKQRSYDFERLEKALLYGEAYELPA